MTDLTRYIQDLSGKFPRFATALSSALNSADDQFLENSAMRKDVGDDVMISYKNL